MVGRGCPIYANAEHIQRWMALEVGPKVNIVLMLDLCALFVRLNRPLSSSPSLRTEAMNCNAAAQRLFVVYANLPNGQGCSQTLPFLAVNVLH